MAHEGKVGTLQRPRRAVPATRGAGQYSDCLSRRQPRSISICCAAKPCDDGANASRFYAEVDAAASGHNVAAGRVFADAFQNVLPDNEVENPRRLLAAPARSACNLRVERAKRKDMSVGIIFVKATLPLARGQTSIKAALDQHPDANEIVWVQREPRQHGCTIVCAAAHEADGREPRPAERKTHSQRQPGNRLREGT